ncbi:hypothetical protein [Halobacillus trueperi]
MILAYGSDLRLLLLVPGTESCGPSAWHQWKQRRGQAYGRHT